MNIKQLIGRLSVLDMKKESFAFDNNIFFVCRPSVLDNSVFLAKHTCIIEKSFPSQSFIEEKTRCVLYDSYKYL